MAYTKKIKLEEEFVSVFKEEEEGIYDNITDDDASSLEDDVFDPYFCTTFYNDNDSEISATEIKEERDINFSTEEAENFENDETHEDDTEINIHSSSNAQYYYGKNRFEWSAQQLQPFAKDSTFKITVKLPTSVSAQHNEDDTENICHRYWSMFIDESIENIIIEHTNRKLDIKFKFMKKLEAKPLDQIEFRAFLGLLLYSGVFKSSRESIDHLFATDGTGRDIFRATMSQLRFTTILSCLRFDNSSNRKARLSSDPLAAISEIFNKVIENCKKNYSMGTYASVGEMLVPFNGKCKFKVFMPQKATKYGIKVMALTDACTHYLANAYIYCGKNPDGVDLTSPTQAVLSLCSTIEGSNRNITAGNWCSSVELVRKLKEHQLTYLGAMRRNKREIPCEFLPNQNRLVGSYIYGFTKDLTLLSYVPKKNHSIILISSKHHHQALDAQTDKPEMLADYNTTKGGVDELNKKCSIFTCGRRTQRWPLAVFYRLMDISGVNAYILYQTEARNHRVISRLNFLKKTARNLILPHLQRREHNQRLPRNLRIAIHSILGSDSLPEPIVPKSISTSGSKLCYICPNKLKRKTTHTCLECSKPMCMRCSKRLCINCVQTEFDE